MKKYQFIGDDSIPSLNKKEVQVFEQVNTNLQNSKERLNEYIGKKNWIKYEKGVDPNLFLLKDLSGNNIPNLDNFWLKYWEILSSFKVLKPETKVLIDSNNSKSLVSAINRYINTFYEKGSFFKWNTITGEGDNTINLFNLFVSDIHFSDIEENSNEQEELSWKRLLESMVRGLKTLKTGGSVIFKMYTFFKPKTWSLLLRYLKFFSNFYMVKPLSSKAYNSEIFVIGMNYNKNDEILQDLERILQTESLNTLKATPTQEILKVASFFFDAQTSALNDLVDGFENKKTMQQEELKLFRDVWISKYPIYKSKNTESIDIENNILDRDTYIIDFTPKYLYISEENYLSDVDIPNENILVNEKLSRLLVYIYTSLAIGPDKTLKVDTEFISMLKTLLPAYEFTDSETVENNVYVINIVEVDEFESVIKYRGTLLKPVYVGRFSRFLYDIHSGDDVEKELSSLYCMASLNYFHNAIRNNFSGRGRCIWRDPISEDTKLRDTYDLMFALYVIDMLLKVIDPEYPNEQSDINLSKGLAFVDYLEGLLVEKKKIEVRDFDMSAVRFDTSRVYDKVEQGNIKLENDGFLRYFTDALLFLTVIGLRRNSEGTVILSDLPSLAFLSKLSGYYPNVNFQAFSSGSTKKSKKKNVVLHGIDLSASEATKLSKIENLYLISNSLRFPIQIANLRPKASLVYPSSVLTLNNLYVGVSLFTNSSDKSNVFAIVTGENAKERWEANKIRNFAAYTNVNWRDTLGYLYEHPITREQENYDKTMLGYLIEKYCNDNDLKENMKARYTNLIKHK